MCWASWNQPTQGTWFDDKRQVAIEDKNEAYRKMQQGYGTRSLIEEYKEKEKKRQFMKERKKNGWCRIRKYGIAEETTWVQKILQGN